MEPHKEHKSHVTLGDILDNCFLTETLTTITLGVLPGVRDGVLLDPKAEGHSLAVQNGVGEELKSLGVST